jgi:hypothetical protein
MPDFEHDLSRTRGATAWWRGALPAARVVPVVALLAWGISGRSPNVPHQAASPADALAHALAAEGLDAVAEDVAWVDEARSMRDTIAGGSRAVVRARRHDEQLHDVFLVRARRSPEGALLRVESVHPLTRTAGVDETRPTVSGEWVAFATVAAGVTTGIELYDLSGEDPKPTLEWKKIQRLQNSLANWQKTGSAKGIQRRRYALEPQPSSVSYSWQPGGELEAVADGHRITFDRLREAPTEGDQYARFEHVNKAKPGDLITWTVDRVRGIEWLGPKFIEYLEYHAFKWRDSLKQKFPKIFAEGDSAEKVVEDLGGTKTKLKPTYTDPEIGFPPGPLKTMLTPTLPNEGVWLSTEDDPFVGKNPGVPAAIVQTFVRTDWQRGYARVYVTLWDPRQVSLHMMAGTVEPVSATGEVGSGQIPRTPEVLKSLVAGFDGGFQSVHFEGGMQVNGTLYLPPKPYSGTVAELRDGTTAIGTWPPDLQTVPDDILSFRQNLTPLVRDGVINPYKQIKWGGTPPGAADNIHTTRSGVCITKDGFVAYFFGDDMSHETLGKGMVIAGCTVAVHLDMNAGHTGFEFYRVAPTGELPDLMRPLDPTWEAEARVPGLDGWSFLARRMVKGMPHMNFPRYIGRDGRDFFYLTLRAVLPGNPIRPRITPPEAKEGVWHVKGLPQHGFPYAIATTTLRPDPKQPTVHAQLLKVDPRAVRAPGPSEEGGSPKVVVSFGGAVPAVKGTPAVWLATGSFFVGSESPGPTAVALFGGEAASPAALATATALLGVIDEDGTLVYAIADAPAGPALKALLQQLGCSQVMLAPKGFAAHLGDSLDLGGELAKDTLTQPVVALVRGEAPSARVLFPETPVVDPQIWAPLQARKVRYYGKKVPKPEGSSTVIGTPTPSSAPSSAPPVGSQ